MERAFGAKKWSLFASNIVTGTFRTYPNKFTEIKVNLLKLFKNTFIIINVVNDGLVQDKLYFCFNKRTLNGFLYKEQTSPRLIFK